MQFTKPFKQAIRSGDVTTSFRAWRSPQAKAGGRYNIHPFGAIEVSRVRQLALAQARPDDVASSGFADIAALAAYLKVGPTDTVYQVDFRYLGESPVNQPTTDRLSAEEVDEVLQRLGRMDKKTPWTTQALTLIDEHPKTRAADLAPRCNMDTPTFKRNVRKLKSLGLTESLEVGYRLSPRGRQVFKKVFKTLGQRA